MGSLLGCLAGVAVVHQTVASPYLRYVALVVGIGRESTSRGLVAFVGVTALFGALFGALCARHAGASFEEDGLAGGADRTKATVFGSLLGGMTGGLTIHHLAHPAQIQLFGALFGVPGSIAKSWATWLLLSLVFGAGYDRLVSQSLHGYVDRVAGAAAENLGLWAVLKPLLDRAPLTTTGSLLGTGYGLVLGLIVGLILAPMTVTLATGFVYPYPSTNLAVLFGYVVFGAFLGAGHGSMLES